MILNMCKISKLAVRTSKKLLKRKQRSLQCRTIYPELFRSDAFRITIWASKPSKLYQIYLCHCFLFKVYYQINKFKIGIKYKKV